MGRKRKVRKGDHSTCRSDFSRADALATLPNVTRYRHRPPARALLAFLCALPGAAPASAGPVSAAPICTPPAVAGQSVAAGPGADGSLTLSDGGRLVLSGIAVPTRLSPVPGLAEAGGVAAAEVLEGRFIAIGTAGHDRFGRATGSAALLPDHAEEAAQDLATALIAAGAGYAVPEGPAACISARLAAETEARAARRGIWAVPGAMAQAGDEAALGLRAGLYAVAEGRISAAGATRDRVFLNFGERWREDFTVIMDRDDFSIIFGDGLDLALLRGTLVRVRGVVREDGGPAIFVTTAGSIERISAAEGEAALQREGSIGREVEPR